MKVRVIYIVVGCVCLSLLSSCSVQQKPIKTDIPIPQAYGLDSLPDGASSGLENWRTFFKDSLLVLLIDSGLAKNYDVQIAYQKVMQSRSAVQFTKGIRMPNLGLNLSAGERKFGDYTIDGVGNYDTQFSPNLNEKQKLPNPVPDYYAGLYSSWEIDLWGRLKNKKRAALARFIAGEQGRNLVITSLIAEIARTYYNLMVLDQEILIIQENIRLQENALDIVEAQMETGKSNTLAIELISAQVLHAKTMLLQVKQSLIVEENKMNVLLGRYPSPVKRSAFTAQTEISKVPVAGVPSVLLQNRPDIQAAEYELRAQRADVKAAKAAFYPSLTLNGNIGYQAFSAALLFEPASVAYSVMGSVMAPLINRRAIRAELMLSKATQREAYLNYEKTILTSFTEVYELMQQLHNFNEMQELKQEQVQVLEKSVETSRLLFASNRAGYLEVITAQQNYLSSQIERLDIHYQKTAATIHLYKALGGGWKQ